MKESWLQLYNEQKVEPFVAPAQNVMVVDLLALQQARREADRQRNSRSAREVKK